MREWQTPAVIDVNADAEAFYRSYRSSYESASREIVRFTAHGLEDQGWAPMPGQRDARLSSYPVPLRGSATDMPRLEAVMSASYAECSMLSAEVARKADKIIKTPDAADTEVVYFVDNDVEDPTVGVYNSVLLAGKNEFPDGRSVDFKLIQLVHEPRAEIKPPIYLVGIARGRIAFPIAAFSRKPGSSCDHVQLGQEIGTDNLVVGAEDETGDRKVILDVINDILDVDPLAVKYAEHIAPQHRVNTYNEEPNRIALKSSRKDGTSSFFSPARTPEEIATMAIYNLHASAEGHSTQTLHYVDGLAEFREKRMMKKADARLKDLDAVDFSSVVAGEFPGSRSMTARKILIAALLNRRGVRPADHQAISGRLNWLAYGFGLQRDMEKRLGHYDQTIERIVDYTSALALGDTVKLSVIEGKKQASGSKIATEVRVTAVPGVRAGDFLLRYAARPLAMPDEEIADVGEFVVSDFYPNVHALMQERHELDKVLSLLDI